MESDLKPLGTNWEKPFLEEAPYLIVVLKQSYGIENGEKIQHYYVNESVGIACGFLIAAIRQAGLTAVTHTPSPMNFLSEILERPFNEKLYLLILSGIPKQKPTYQISKENPLMRFSKSSKIRKAIKIDRLSDFIDDGFLKTLVPLQLLSL